MGSEHGAVIGDGLGNGSTTNMCHAADHSSHQSLDEVQIDVTWVPALMQPAWPELHQLRRTLLRARPEQLRLLSSELAVLTGDPCDPCSACLFWVAANVWFGRLEEALRVAECLPSGIKKKRVVTRLLALQNAIDDTEFVKSTISCRGESEKPHPVLRDKKTSRIRRRDGRYFVKGLSGSSEVSYCVWCNTHVNCEDVPLII